MNIIKKAVALTLALLLVLSFCGCHKQNEIAVKADGVEFTSGYYMCALVHADLEARTKVDSAKQSETTDGESTETTETTDYYSEKIDEKEFTVWVKDRALDTLRDIALFKNLLSKNKITITEESQSTAEQYASALWSYLSELLEGNGVSQATYAQFIADYASIADDTALQSVISSAVGFSGNIYTKYTENRYFDFVYGGGGEKEIPSEDISNSMLTKYVAANMISITLSDLEDDQAQEKTDFLEAAAKDINNGKKTFVQVYNEFSVMESDGEDTTEYTEDDVDIYILGDTDTEYVSSFYSDVKDLAVGTAVVLDDDANSAKVLIVKKDIASNEEINTNEAFKTSIRRSLKGDEFDKDIAELAKKVKVTEIKSATKQFDVKKIKYPESSN